MTQPKIIQTERLSLRHLSIEDAEFILKLVNEPSWIQFIGDKGVRNLDDARNYILKGPVEMYQRFGFGLFLTELKDSAEPIGLCGLIKRDTLDDVDIGFAFLPKYWGRGYAFEAASAVLDFGKSIVGLTRLVAITKPDNHSSIKLLEKIGLRFERTIKLGNESQETKLFGRNFTTD